jgi:prophage DNA circulation protein
MTIYFDGDDHDVTARNFFSAIRERGAWRVVHPVYGAVTLQPVKVTAKVFTDTTGNVTEISGDWFEPAEETESAPDSLSLVEKSVDALIESAAADAGQMKLDTASAKQSAVGEIKKGFNEIKKWIRNANARIMGIMNTINELTTSVYLDIASVSGAVIQLTTSPGLFLGSLSNRVSMFTKLGKNILAGLADAGTFSYSQINAALTGELWVNAVISGLGSSIMESRPETRAEAISVLTQFLDFVNTSRAALDAYALRTKGNFITQQYFPRSTSEDAVLELTAAVSRYLLSALYDLNAERVIVLDAPRSPLEITVTELNAAAGNFDEKYAALCRRNGFSGREMLLLPTGTEVTLYE